MSYNAVYLKPVLEKDNQNSILIHSDTYSAQSVDEDKHCNYSSKYIMQLTSEAWRKEKGQKLYQTK